MHFTYNYLCSMDIQWAVCVWSTRIATKILINTVSIHDWNEKETLWKMICQSDFRIWQTHVAHRHIHTCQKTHTHAWAIHAQLSGAIFEWLRSVWISCANWIIQFKESFENKWKKRIYFNCHVCHYSILFFFSNL